MGEKGFSETEMVLKVRSKWESFFDFYYLFKEQSVRIFFSLRVNDVLLARQMKMVGVP